MAEQIFSDFSSGMNALGAVDKLNPNECLLAENVRLDEIGNIQSAGALTAQNTAAYAAAAGTNSNYVHSHFYQPSIGAVAGVGQDVFVGASLGSMSRKSTGTNPAQQKMSFGAAPARVYFDIGSTGYWTDTSNLLTVDWTPPIAAGSTVTSSACGTASQTAGGNFITPWDVPANIVSTSSSTVATCQFTTGVETQSEYLYVTMSTNSFAFSGTPTGIGVTMQILANNGIGPPSIGDIAITLLKNGVPVGNFEPILVPTGNGTFYAQGNAGGQTDLWGTTWSQADVNSGTFGFLVQVTSNIGPVSIYGATVSLYSGTGFFAGTGTTGTLTGTYSYKVTFVAQNGEESDASSESSQIVLNGSMGTLTSIPMGDARTSARNIYRIGNLLTVHYLVGSIQDNRSTTYADNLPDLSALSTGVILSGEVPGDYPNSRLGNQSVRFPVYHYDRVFWINPSQPNQLIWSKPLNGFAYPDINTVDVGNSSAITRHVSIFGELIILKADQSVWRLTGTDESSFDLSQTPSSSGTDLPFTVATMPDRIPFMNRLGLWVFNGYSSIPFTSKLDLWFKQLDRTNVSLFGVNGFHPPEVSSMNVPKNFEAVANSEKFVLAYAEAGQTKNNAILSFDVKHNNITKRQLGTAFPLSLSMDPTNGYVYVGDTNGFISLLDDWNGATQNGANVNFDFQTSYIDLQRGSNKSIWALEFYGNLNGQSLTPTVYYDNGVSSETLTAITNNGLTRIVRPLESTASRKCQNFSVRLNGSISAVNVAGAPRIQINYIKALFDIRAGRARTGQT